MQMFLAGKSEYGSLFLQICVPAEFHCFVFCGTLSSHVKRNDPHSLGFIVVLLRLVSY